MAAPSSAAMTVATSVTAERAALMRYARRAKLRARAVERSTLPSLLDHLHRAPRRSRSGVLVFDAAEPDAAADLCKRAAHVGLQSILIVPARSAWSSAALLDARPVDFVYRPLNAVEATARILRCMNDVAPPAETALPPGPLQADLVLCALGFLVRFADQTVRLRRAEFRVLELLVNMAPMPVTRADILRDALASSGDGSSARQQIYELRRKLQVLGLSDVIETFPGTAAYRWCGPAPKRAMPEQLQPS